MIRIKAWYGPWRTVSEAKALSFIRNSFFSAQAMPKNQKTLDYIQQRHLRGMEFSLTDIVEQSEQEDT